MSEQNKQLSRRFTELFGTDDLSSVNEVFSDDIVFHGTSGDGELHGIAAMRGLLEGYRGAFPDANSTVEDQVAEGDKVVTRWTARGTHDGPLGDLEPTGRRFVMDGITIERMENGRIAEVWVSRDELGLMRLLGVVPGSTLETEVT